MSVEQNGAMVRALLKRIARKPPLARKTKDKNHIVLTFEGVRTIKASAQIVKLLIDRALVTASAGSMDEELALSITDVGRQWLATGDKAEWPPAASTVQANLPKRNLSESPLSRLYTSSGNRSASWLTRNEFAAGERLRNDFELACLQPGITARWDIAGSAAKTKGRAHSEYIPSEAAMDARKRIERAANAVGPELAGVMIDVCCFLKGLGQIEMERQWPRRSAKLLLKAALAQLDRHYYPRQGGAGKSRHWGADGYRPALWEG